MKKISFIKTALAALVALLMIMPGQRLLSYEWEEVDISDGKEYWFGIAHCMRSATENIRWGQYAINLWVASKYETMATISSADGSIPTQSHQVKPNQIKIISIPDHLECKESEVVEPNGIHVVGNDPIQLAIFTAYKWSGEAYRVTPVEWLGKKYFTLSLYQDHCKMADGITEYKPGQILIIASEDGTSGYYKPTAETEKVKINGVGSFSLDKGETFLIQSKVIPGLNQYDQTDLTGTYIQANKPIAVISGHTKGAYPRYPVIFLGSLKSDFMRNMMVEMMWPVELLGQEYVSAPIKYLDRYNYGTIDEDKGDLIRFIATEDNTTIYQMRLNGDGLMQLRDPMKAGEWYEISSQESARYYYADKPIVMGQYGKAWWSEAVETDKDGDNPLNPHRNGQGMLMTLAPVEHWCQNAIFYSVPDMDNFFYITYLYEDFKKIKLDGQYLYMVYGAAGAKAISGTEFCYTIATIGPGTHYLDADDEARFAAYAYGNWDYAKDGFAYGYPVGINYAKQCEDSLVIIPESICGNYEVHAYSVPDTVECAGIFNVVFETEATEYSDNYYFELDEDFETGATEAHFKLTVIDPRERADAIVKVITTSGKTLKDNNYYSYIPDEIAFDPDYLDFGTLKAGDKKSMKFTIYNMRSDTSVTINKLYLRHENYDKFEFDVEDWPLTIAAAGSMEVTVNAVPKEYLNYIVRDTVWAELECFDDQLIPLQFDMGIPKIVVSDINFGTLKLGTSSNPVEAYIENRDGGADLEIYGYSYDENSPFEIVSGFEETLDKGIPIVIEPNGKPVTFEVVYTPQTIDVNEEEMCYFENNANDNPDPYSKWIGKAATSGPVITGWDWGKRRVEDAHWVPDDATLGYAGRSEIEAIGSDGDKLTVDSLYIKNNDEGAFIIDPEWERPGILTVDEDRPPEIVPVYFKPMEEKDYEATIIIYTSNAGMVDSAEAQLTGWGVQPHAFITGWNFGTLNLNEETSRPGYPPYGHVQPDGLETPKFMHDLTIFDIRVEDMDGTPDGATIFQIDPDWYAEKLAGDKSIVITDANDSDPITVKFVPGTPNRKRAWLVMEHDGPEGNGIIRDTLEGDAYSYNAEPEHLSYNAEYVSIHVPNSTHPAQFISLKNTGDSPFTIQKSIESSYTNDLTKGEFTVTNIEIVDANDNLINDNISVSDVDIVLESQQKIKVYFDYVANIPGNYNETFYWTFKFGEEEVVLESYMSGIGQYLYVMSEIPKYAQESEREREKYSPGSVLPIDFKLYRNTSTQNETKSIESANITEFYAYVYFEADDNEVTEVYPYSDDEQNIAKVVLDEETMVEGWTIDNNDIEITDEYARFHFTNTNGNALAERDDNMLFQFRVRLYLSDRSHVILNNDFVPLSGTTDQYVFNTPVPGDIKISPICVNEKSLLVLSTNQYELYQNAPNPVSGKTKIKFSVAFDDNTTIELFNADGRKVGTLLDEKVEAGIYEIEFNPVELGIPSGVYYYRMRAAQFEDTKSILITK